MKAIPFFRVHVFGRRVLLAGFFILFTHLVHAQQEGTPPTSRPEQNAARPDRMPEFPGGIEAMMNFLTSELKYPKDAKEPSTVVMAFTVKADGTLADMIARKTAGEAFTIEAMRVLKKMPKWHPAVSNGKPVDYVMTLPIRFEPAP